MQQSSEVRRYLGVDIGNSGLRLTELDVAHQQLGATTRIAWRFSPNRPDSPPLPGANLPAQYRPDDVRWLSEIEDYLHGIPSIWMISSVRSDALHVLRSALEQRVEHSVRAVQHTDIPIQVNVDRPDRVGIDRLLAALAAGSLTDKRPLIVIEAGSAVTVDLLCSGRDNGSSTSPDCLDSFEGGAIIPGVPMMLRLLGQGADQLPEIEVDEFTDWPPLPGKNTEAAMLCGAASALLGGVQHVVQRYRESLGMPVLAILSGGDGLHIAPHIMEPLIIEQHLVQRGLMMLANRCRGETRASK